jgi:hypothetical protein
MCVIPALLFILRSTFSWQILIRCGINGDDSLIDPLSRVILGLAAAQTHNYEYALQCFQRSADEGSWNAMRKLAALFVFPAPSFKLGLIGDYASSAIAQHMRFSCRSHELARTRFIIS